MGHQIHAAMCAPLAGRAAVAGALYADSGKSSAPFSENDFQLFTAITHVVGVAVVESGGGGGHQPGALLMLDIDLYNRCQARGRSACRAM